MFVLIVCVCVTVCGYVIMNLIMIFEEKSIGTQGSGSKLIFITICIRNSLEIEDPDSCILSEDGQG